VPLLCCCFYCCTQGEAIAYNLREMFGLRVPVISVVIGEGGSGGALAIGCANKNIIMENAVYYVASPEACAAILWKSRTASSQVRHAHNIRETTAPGLGMPLQHPPAKLVCQHVRVHVHMHSSPHAPAWSHTVVASFPPAAPCAAPCCCEAL
jgi:hypothetical protein